LPLSFLCTGIKSILRRAVVNEFRHGLSEAADDFAIDEPPCFV
jgi:hypothetical protein